ncbi:MAG: hypothetical protein KDA68_09605 [Planctomycetaceae bacterium]|nr:hypothetical protein [Planctomycetaceae bacterium]
MLTKFFGVSPFGVSVRRKNGSRGIGRSPEACESRLLLSASKGSAVKGKVVATADPPADFSGTWITTTNEGNASTVIDQSGPDVFVLFHSSTVNVDNAQGKVNGNKAVAKFKMKKGADTQVSPTAFVGPPALKIKIKLTLTDTDQFEGSAKGKTVDGKFKLTLEGTRI